MVSGIPKGSEKVENHLVPAPGFVRKLAASVGEENRTIRLGGDKAVALEALNGPADSHMSDTEAPGQVNRARLTHFGDEVGDHFHVILRCLLAMFFAGATTVRRGGFRARGTRLFGNRSRAFHWEKKKAEKYSSDNFYMTCISRYIFMLVYLYEPDDSSGAADQRLPARVQHLT